MTGPGNRQRSAAPDANISATQPEAKVWVTQFGKLVSALILGSGVIATGVSAFFQGRSWNYQNRVDNIAKDSEAVLKALQDMNIVIEERWLSTYRLNDAIKNKLPNEQLKTAQLAFAQANHHWELAHNGLSAAFEISVDSPFGIKGADKLGRVWTLDCRNYTLGGEQHSGADPVSARVLLEVSDHCNSEINKDFDALADPKKTDEKLKPLVEPDLNGKRLDYVWRVNNVLRCLTVERAVAIRASFPKRSFLPNIFEGAPQKDYNIDTRNEEKCLKQYDNEKDTSLAPLVR